MLAIIHGRAALNTQTERSIKTWAKTRPHHELHIHHTNATKNAFDRVKSDPTIDVVISCGGDGTNNEVLNGIMELNEEDRPSLAIVPLGSGNDFARVLPKRTLAQSLLAIEQNRPTWIDVLHIESSDRRWHALNMITCGIGAEIAATVNRRKFSLPSAINYYSAIVHWLLKYRAPMLEITDDSGTSVSCVFLTALGNGTFAGNGLGLNPQSTINDGEMGITVIGDVSVFDFLRHQSTLKKAVRVADPRLSYRTTKACSIRVKKGTCAIETDGEVLTRLSVEEIATIHLLPRAVRIL
ncbi:MAG: diacylglycerol kinase family protein [Cryomorphaceae bacterium]